MKSLAFACIAYLKKQNLLSKTKAKILINPKKAWGGGEVIVTSCGFNKCVFSRENFIIRHIFPITFIEIAQVNP